MMEMLFLMFVMGALLIGPTPAEAQVVKKSSSGICHCPGAPTYKRTKVFESYPTIEACIASDGRYPRDSGGISGQGNRSSADGTNAPKTQSNIPQSSPSLNRNQSVRAESTGGSYLQREQVRIAKCLSGQNLPLWTYDRCGIDVKPVESRKWQ